MRDRNRSTVSRGARTNGRKLPGLLEVSLAAGLTSNWTERDAAGANNRGSYETD